MEETPYSSNLHTPYPDCNGLLDKPAASFHNSRFCNCRQTVARGTTLWHTRTPNRFHKALASDWVLGAAALGMHMGLAGPKRALIILRSLNNTWYKWTSEKTSKQASGSNFSRTCASKCLLAYG